MMACFSPDNRKDVWQIMTSKAIKTMQRHDVPDLA